MLCILSPAKTLDLTPHPSPQPSSQPLLLGESAPLAVLGAGLSVAALRKLMKLSEALAEKTASQFSAFELPFTDDNTLPAALTFAGTVYQGLDARTLSDDDLRYAHSHLAILSGLYGVLRPLDGMQPYRLEMGTRLETPRGKGLYAYWGERVTAQLDAMTVGHRDRTVVDLASQEYSRVVQPEGLAGGMLRVKFKERKDGVLKTVAVYAKRARGELARYAVVERLEEPGGLRGFTGMGYRYDAAASAAGEWVFTR
ncbi:MAG: cytoplasmic iron level regulating protein YaaA (DUF328/UPF0246 family) [Myxococcota bacterium]|jgi:cytoplasmic iron level regulating protein YaaA (DUF328/UPF0246 family)